MRSSLCLLALMAACAKSDDQPAAKPGASPEAQTLDACSLLTREDVVAAVGRSDFSAGKSRDGGTQCRFSSGRGSVTLTARPAPRSQWDELRETLRREGKNIGEVRDLGDAAYHWDQRVYVHLRGREVTVHVSPGSPTPSAEEIAKDRAAAIAVAKVAVERVP